MSEHEREVDISGIRGAGVSSHDQAPNTREEWTEPSSRDDDLRAAAPDSRSDGPRVSIDDIDAAARAWDRQEYGEVM